MTIEKRAMYAGIYARENLSEINMINMETRAMFTRAVNAGDTRAICEISDYFTKKCNFYANLFTAYNRNICAKNNMPEISELFETIAENIRAMCFCPVYPDNEFPGYHEFMREYCK